MVDLSLSARELATRANLFHIRCVLLESRASEIDRHGQPYMVGDETSTQSTLQVAVRDSEADLKGALSRLKKHEDSPHEYEKFDIDNSVESSIRISILEAKSRSFQREIEKMRAMIQQNHQVISEVFEGQDFGGKQFDLAQQAQFNQTLSSCVEHLDEYSVYLKAAKAQAKADLQLEQDLLDEHIIIHRQLCHEADQWKKVEGGAVAVQQQLKTLEERNDSLVKHMFEFIDNFFDIVPAGENVPSPAELRSASRHSSGGSEESVNGAALKSLIHDLILQSEADHGKEYVKIDQPDARADAGSQRSPAKSLSPADTCYGETEAALLERYGIAVRKDCDRTEMKLVNFC